MRAPNGRRVAAQLLRRMSDALTVPAPNAARDHLAAAAEILNEAPILDVQRVGYHFQRRDYYSALNDLDFLSENRDLWTDRALPRGIAWDLDQQIEVLRQIAHFISELEDVPQSAAAGSTVVYQWENDFWRGMDAIVHYGLLREFRPAHVVEIGCGWSSLLMMRALAKNAQQDAAQGTVHQIEPYPRTELMAALPADWTRETAILQRASLEPVERLQAGDILFYDGSHVARVASDVNWFFFEVLPRVAPGVIIHIHDIFLPDDYPESWIFERGQTWNEQYLLQAFLMFNEEFEVLVSNAAVLKERREEVLDLLGNSGDDIVGGGSVWIRRRIST
jgi:Methyltransferase domain